MAILLVMALHTIAYLPARGLGAIPVTLARGGWVGVDVFFVLSGYLITGILLETRSAAGYWRSFYGRRVLRIWPLYLLVVATLTALAALAAGGVAGDAYRSHAAGFLRAAPWFWTHTSNLAALGAPAGSTGTGLDWFGAGIFWSLAVEEQFYFVWPFVVALVAPRRLAAVALGVALASAGTRVALAATGTPFPLVNVLPLTHADGLAVGAALAALAHRGVLPRLVWPARRLALGYVVFVAVLTVLAPGADSAVVQSVGIALGAGWGALLVLAARDPAAQVRGGLAAPWLVAVGRRSYGLYILHGPALFLAPRLLRARWPETSDVTVIAVALAASFALAWVSWRWWEGPWLRLKRYVPRPVPVGAPSRAEVSHRVRVGTARGG